MTALATNPTGAELVEAVRARARELGVPAHRFAEALSPLPSQWLGQTARASRPKPHTIARVEALLAGRPVPPPPPNNFQGCRANAGAEAVSKKVGAVEPVSRPAAGRTAAATSEPMDVTAGETAPASPACSIKPRNGLYSAEAEIFRLHDEGNSRERIVALTGRPASYVAQVLAFGSEAGTAAMKRDLAAGSARLLKAIAAESVESAKRRRLAAVQGSDTVLEIDRPRPVERLPARLVDETRPRAAGRDPCSRCGVRGDLGCRHQSPAEAA